MGNLIMKGEPHYFLRKSDFGVKGDAHSSDYATWDWVLKRKYPWMGQESRSMAITLPPIKVFVWDLPDKGCNRGLIQEFTPDREGTRAAHKYARLVIEEYGALLSSVETRINLPMKYGQALEFTSYDLVRS